MSARRCRYGLALVGHRPRGRCVYEGRLDAATIDESDPVLRAFAVE